MLVEHVGRGAGRRRRRLRRRGRGGVGCSQWDVCGTVRVGAQGAGPGRSSVWRPLAAGGQDGAAGRQRGAEQVHKPMKGWQPRHVELDTERVVHDLPHRLSRHPGRATTTIVDIRGATVQPDRQEPTFTVACSDGTKLRCAARVTRSGSG